VGGAYNISVSRGSRISNAALAGLSINIDINININKYRYKLSKKMKGAIPS